MAESRRTLAAIPTYNEPNGFRVAEAVAPLVHATLVIDDGSTVPLGKPPPGVRVHRFADNRGYGDVVQVAIDSARRQAFDALILVDADGQHDVSHVSQLLGALEDAHLAVGCRFDPESPRIGVPPPALRREANEFFRAVMRHLCPRFAVRDFFSGFLAFNVAAIPEDLALHGSPMRLWPCVTARSLRVANVSVPCIYRTASADNFLAQYGSLQTLFTKLFSEFASACSRFLARESEVVCSASRSELTRFVGTSIYPYLDRAIREFEDPDGAVTARPL